MRRTISGLTVLLAGCFSSGENPILSQKYVHKYGFEVTPGEWNEREGDGQIVELLVSGVKVSRSYENGVLHGKTSYTYPHSSVVEKVQVYDQGNLLKETLNDSRGVPVREEIYEFDDRKIITEWDENGAPLSIEEYSNGSLVDGKYYTTSHELEGQVEGGYGERVKRERSGLLLSRDTIQGGEVIAKTTYHPSGEVHTISHFKNDQLHGEQLKFTSTGKPLMKLHWDHGVLNGDKIVYRNGIKVAEIPYVNGQKEGMEIHFDDLGNLTAEIEWQKDKKHGCSKFYTDDATEHEWFYRGQAVSLGEYEMFANRDRLVADLQREKE
jgi:antitoxin component YwqK of YwqJK toxin-antitoxin module